MRAVIATAALLLLTAFVWLGLWQLERADQKRVLFQSFDSGESLAVDMSAVRQDTLEASRYLKLELRGRFEPQEQVLLDAMTHAGQAGYHVLTPFLPVGGEQRIIVNRGWIPASADRMALPDLSISETERTIRGRIDTLPRPGIRLGSPPPDAAAKGTRIFLFPTIQELEDALGIELLEFQLLLDASEPDGFLRAWQPRSMPPERHVGYAIQWFGLAVLLIGIAGVLGIRAIRRREGPRAS